MRNLTIRVTAPIITSPTPHFWRRSAATGQMTPDGDAWARAEPVFEKIAKSFTVPVAPE